MASLLCDLGVAARVIREEKILLVQEASGPHQGKWGFPKGRVDPGESPEAAALRELAEESGHDGQVLGLAGVRTALRKGQPAVFLCYDVQVNTEVDHHTSEEISNTAWCSSRSAPVWNGCLKPCINWPLTGSRAEASCATMQG